MPRLKSNGYYNVSWKVLDSRQIGGLPQRRQRLWIIGVRKDVGKFKWPKPLRGWRDIKLSNFLGRKNLDYEFPTSRSGKKRLVAGIETLVQDGHSLDDTWVIDTGASEQFSGHPAHELCPCLTRTRGGCPSFWITSHKRFLNLREKAIVMGWDPSTLMPESLSSCELGQALGNAWPLTVSARLVGQLKRLFKWN
ncbi:unnamed protein product [Cladocopium goreaui]|uniref:DNA (cytosine-5-)-methyltransferase n=1 Tax=Cladocopium goreaui TaxID=2562237 RepID=A0A9P1BLI1_9DINO|nr:unnamed protein product [Cladocopium goreaui]